MSAAGPAAAVIGMAGRFPGAADPDALWSMLAAGNEAVRRFTPAELRAAGVAGETLADPGYVPFGADLSGIEDFDAAFFGITPADARLTDPQHRVLLECVWAALEDAGTPPTAHGGRIGVFASTSLSSYLLHHVLRHPDHRDQAFSYPVLLGNDKDFLATRISYALDLHGPSVSVQSACSSSLVAVDQACAALRAGRCDVAVAGGVSVFTPQTVGHRHLSGGTYSRDGHCRPFDAAASGMVRGSGCGVVVLKRLDDALADRDHIHAVVAGTAVNNDGRTKAAYTAPSAEGQHEVIRACLDACAVPASRIGYVEAHGTGTYLGDPIEVAALHRAYRDGGDPPHACALGSVKANIGHLDAAAGVTGLIKTVLVLRHQAIPPQINFTEPNPELRLHETPFTVTTHLVRPARPLLAAAVTSLGIGGTNAHCVLTPAPAPPGRPPAPAGAYTLRLSAPDEDRVRDAAGDLLAHLERHPGTRLDDLAHTLAHGRLPLDHRTAVTASTVREAVARLRDLRDGTPAGPGTPDPGRVGDTSHARTVRLPGIRLRRERHWIEAGSPAPPARAANPQDPGAPADPVEAAAEVFRTRLGVAAVGPDDDFFALGGDSLHAIEAVDALNRHLGTHLSLERFTSLRTPRQVARWCDEPHDDQDTMVVVKEGAPGHERGPVFLIHPSGGTIAFAQALARHTTDTSPVHAIRYPAALRETLTTVARMARHYVRLIRRAQPHGPYRIGGYSLGGSIALEAARLLTDSGEYVEQVLLWDTRPPGAQPAALPEQDFRDLFPGLLRLMFALPGPSDPAAPASYRTAEEAIESVRRPDWTPATVRELRTLYDVWRVCDRAAAGHRPPPYSGAVHLFAAREPLPQGAPGVFAGGAPCTAEEWRPYLTGDLRVTVVPGHHFSMFDPQWLPALAAAYDRALRTAPPAADRPPPPPAPDPGARPVALLFPGQGSQHTGMGRELLARYPDLVAEADQVLGYSIAAVCAGDPRRPLKDTAYGQPAIYVVGALAARDHLREYGEHPAVLLGHSVGEYNALEAAGVFTFAEGLRLVAARAAAMSRIAGGMIAVTGLSCPEILAVVGDHGPVDLAAVNAPRNHSLSGPEEDLEALTPVLLERGARSVRRLNVSGPFHSRLMAPAAARFRSCVEDLAPRWSAPAAPVIANTTARPHTVEALPDELVAQIDHPVRWARSLERAIADHDPRFHEIGGRRVLTPMVTQVRAALPDR
ncbi:beta-ketoacyl synthase N-terminal-like domain-containing protein [Streptantibioticus silvisoli]|uniref:Beta-ketoacyl synthase N-terminal-like domain-containing protein n=1 Tax=Streptantibioticus silvisoli TaxID=2705255 RepID=A0ABT6W970_9ACTN|nr:beta-ketoacyl synthase N-terminal-like domain-containing protein [Streptantibioticus silvisoli]MDI5966482.1 beta-ketoacyl synthase N-terminal-like domain-containing protein [Streptantibioticus silvisoli]